MPTPSPPVGQRRRVLIVEDEQAIRELLRLHLQAAGYAVEESGDGSSALRRLRQEAFDLVILDVMLPGLDGVSLCRAVRLEGPNRHAPILMVTARDGEADKVMGLESGADDYVAKPFGVRELMARVTAVTRRQQRAETGGGQPASAVAAGPVVTDLHTRQVTVRGKRVDVTRQEFDVLHQLVSRRGMVFSRAALLHAVWPDDDYVNERTVDAVISRLRRKVEEDPRDPALILTAWGVGYKFTDADD